MEDIENGWEVSRCCAWALSLGVGLRRGRVALRGHGQQLGPARVRRQGRKRRRWRGPQAQPRTRAPQRPLTGGAPAEAKQAGGAGAAPPERTRSTHSVDGQPEQHGAKKSAAPAIHGVAHQGLSATSIRRRYHRLQLFDHAGFDEYTRLLGRDRNVEDPGKRVPLQMRHPPGAVRLIRLHQA